MLKSVNQHRLKKKEETPPRTEKEPKQKSEIKSMVIVNPSMHNQNRDSYSYLESYRAKQRASLVGVAP